MNVHLNVGPHLDSLKALLSAAESDEADLKQDPQGLHQVSPAVKEAVIKVLQEVRRDEGGCWLSTLLSQGWLRLMEYDFRAKHSWDGDPKSTSKFVQFVRELTEERTLSERTRLLALASAAGVKADTIAYTNDELRTMCRLQLAESDLLQPAA